MTRAFRYPLRPNTAQARVLSDWLGVCCDLYNAALQERRDAWRIARKPIGYLHQQKQLTELRAIDHDVVAISATVERSALRRADLAFGAFFRRCKSGEAPGYPRFRSRRRYESFTFQLPRIDGNRVVIPNFGPVRFHRYRPVEGIAKEATIGRDVTGKWFVSFACAVGDAPSNVPVRAAVGIDLGLTSFATLSDGTDVENPRFARVAAARIRRCKKALSRRQRRSASRERARIALARASAHIANQRKDFARKLACDLFRRYDLIAYEDLKISRMVHGSFAKSIHDAGWGVFLQALVSKAESAGKHAIAVDPRGTTQRCSGCAERVPKGIAERRHVCKCGVDLGRDHNAALNVLALGRSAVEALKFDAVEAGGAP